jgi:hypothetical protein
MFWMITWPLVVRLLIVITLLPDALPTNVFWKFNELGVAEISVVVFCAKASVVKDTIKQMQQAVWERRRRAGMVIEKPFRGEGA